MVVHVGGFTWRGTAGIHNGGRGQQVLKAQRLAAVLPACNATERRRRRRPEAAAAAGHQGQGAVRSGRWSQLPACVYTV